MEQELISKRVAIIGAGPAGCIAAKYISEAGIDVTLFDKGDYLNTILPTGAGRCNISNAIWDYKELASNYPRGEKFLYSIFSRYSTKDAIQFFKSIGIETYIQKDNRIFPVSNSSIDVRQKFLKALSKVTFIKDEIISIKILNGINLYAKNNQYNFDVVIIAIGGHSSYKLCNNLGLCIVPPTQALVGLKTKTNFSSLSGVSIKNVKLSLNKQNLSGDILFTHVGLSGPLIYKISSIFARHEFPFSLNFKLIDDINLQELFNANPHKEIKNLLTDFLPKSFVLFFLNNIGCNANIRCCDINSVLRKLIFDNLINYNIQFIGKCTKGEVVTCGGISLNEVNSKTLESKKYKNLYFCGEVLDIDGFCGGFNLQNCWSTGAIAAQTIISKSSH